jgi:hypothetical protein
VYEIQWSESNSYFGETTTDDSPMGKGHDKTFTMDISAYSGDYTFGVWTGGSTSQMYASGNVSYVQCS